jgi:hypothetical protein
MQGGRLLENLNLVEGFPVVDTNGGKTSDWISVQNYKRCVVIFAASAGTGDSIVTINQAKDIAGTGSKALNFTTFYTKAATTDLTATPNWTKNTQAAANTATVASWAAKSKLCAIEFHAEEFDFANQFYFINAVLSGASAATLGYVLFLLGEARYPCAPESMLTAIS